MPAEMTSGHRQIRRRRDGSPDHDFYRRRALRRKALVQRALLRRCVAAVRHAVACIAAIAQAAAQSWQQGGVRRAGMATAAIVLAVASYASAQPSGNPHAAGGHTMVGPSELKWAAVPSLPPGARSRPASPSSRRLLLDSCTR
jgi:hypothetical protein